MYRKCVDDTCDDHSHEEKYCGESGVLRVRFQQGSGFYPEGGVANVAVIREDTSVDDEFTVRYSTAGVTASGNDDYRSMTGEIRFNKGQNHRYISIPVFDGSGNSNNEFFQVVLSELTTKNRAAAADITLATHLGVIHESNNNEQQDVVDYQDSCVCHPTPTPMKPVEITVAWSEYNPPVIKHDGVCYYRTLECRCGDMCDLYDVDHTYSTCEDCLSGFDELGDVWEICVELGDEYIMCGEVYELCEQYDVYGIC